jgi:hypothetical protein
MMVRWNGGELPTVNDWADVPSFANEDEEAEFWATHSLGGAALESLGTFNDEALPPPRPRRRRFWHQISRQNALNEQKLVASEKPVVQSRYARLGRTYRSDAA